MPTKTQRIIGWTLTVLVGLFLIGASGIPKFLDISKIPSMADMMDLTWDHPPAMVDDDGDEDIMS